MKFCPKCKTEKELTEFHKWSLKYSKDGLNSWCKECVNKKNNEYRTLNPDRYKTTGKLEARRLKDEVIAGYGGVCACCKEDTRVFLSLDHVHGGGRQERGKRGTNFAYRDARRRNFPPDYQILCFNCNWAKHFLGKCPHTSKDTPSNASQNFPAYY